MWISIFSNSCSTSSNISSFNIILFHELFAICLHIFSAIVCITKKWHCCPLSVSVIWSIYHSLLAERVTLKCLFSLLQLVHDMYVMQMPTPVFSQPLLPCLLPCPLCWCLLWFFSCTLCTFAGEHMYTYIQKLYI